MRVTNDLERRIGDITKLRPRLIALAAEAETPLYVYDAEETVRNLKRYHQAFAAEGLQPRLCYAIKSNPCPALLKTVVAAGDGLDASSPRELRLALRAGARRILFTGPGKSQDDLALALKHHRRVIVHLESRRELATLARLAANAQQRVTCGLRLVTKHQRGWSKFGIPLEDLAACWRAARRYPWINLAGLQFHSGTLETPKTVVATLREIARYLRGSVPREQIDSLKFVDVGGGIVPESFEGLYPWNRAQSMSFARDPGLTRRILDGEIRPHYEALDLLPVEAFAAEIAAAFRRHLLSLNPSLALYAEPGKFISHSTMHLLFRVVEIKGPQAVIVDGGTNMIGWEKYEFFDYAPIFNLSRFSPRKERPTLVYGSLCTPHDLWGYYVRGGSLRVGDLLCMPYQGAYTYTLAQQFIRPIPPVVVLPPGKASPRPRR